MSEAAPKAALVGLVMEPPEAETCGNCHYGKLFPQRLGIVECWGAPPVPTVIGGRPGLAGQVEMTVELLRPQIDSRCSGCALWRAKSKLAGPMAGRG